MLRGDGIDVPRRRARRGERAPASVRLPGAFNVANALAAIVALTALGSPACTLRSRGSAPCAGVPGRMERVDAGQPFLALVDYAHTPDAVRHPAGRRYGRSPGRVIVVLGCGGDRDPYKRPLMGAAACAGSPTSPSLTSDNPRSEDPAAILAAMAGGASTGPRQRSRSSSPTGGAAIALAVAAARPGDVVVVAGKGHEQGQEVAGVVRPFDDRVELRAAIERLAVAS